jgi:Fic family protein
MYIEVRRHGAKKLYYLTHSFRVEGKVKKIRKYLGRDLGKETLTVLRKQAEKELIERAKSSELIGDPLHTVLSKDEKKSIEDLIKRKGRKLEVMHLSEEDWMRFTEDFAFNTNAIEGSSVTSTEVRGMLKSDKWPAERTRQEIAETYGVSEAVKYIRKTKEHLSIPLLRELHRIVFSNSLSYAGNFREKGVEVAVVDGYGNIIHRGAPQKDVVRRLRELTEWYCKNKDAYHPIVIAGVVHNQFENIHPFRDGNGRAGRLLLNNILLKQGMPPVNIELKNRSEYYRTLQAYENEGNIRPTIELILKEYRNLRNVTTK